jgi:hypothetical protein
MRPADVLRDLVTLLRGYGLTHLYWSACAACGVLSLPRMTVWLCDGQSLSWRHEGTHALWPAHDIEGAARRLATLSGHVIPGGPANSPR